MGEYLDRIVDILNEFNIKHIISIDDDWGKRNLNIELKVDLYEFIDQHLIEVNDEEQITIENEGISTLEELLVNNSEVIEKLKTKIRDIINSTEEREVSIQSLQEILEKIDEKDTGIKIEKYYSTEINFNDYGENCLFILDKNMGGKETDVVVDSILEINKSSKNRNDLIIVYSNELTEDYDSQSSKLDYLKKKEKKEKEEINELDLLLISYQIWGIEKTGDPYKLIESINETLLKSAFGNSLHRIIRTKIFIENNTYNELLQIDTDRFFSLANDSLIEGDTILQSLERVFFAMKNRNLYMNSDETYHDSLKNLNTYEKMKIKEIIAKTSSYKNYRKEELIKTLQSSQQDNLSSFSVIDYNINKVYGDVSTGDLFVIKRQSNYECGILITQACDCVIRIPANDIQEIKRKAENMKLLILEMEKIPNPVTVKYASDIQQKLPEYIWPINIDRDNYILKPTKEIYRLPSYILDLCSLNKEGQACINFDMNEVLKFKSYHSSKYFETLKERYYGDEFKHEGRKISDIIYSKIEEYISSELASTIEEVDNEIFDATISLKYGVDFKGDKFEIIRIGRVELARTLKIIQNYASYLSVPGTERVNFIN
ncbi:hypothetical protein NE686_00310 [Tissierella carlieri]|uniref:Uncharacterized protein n=1 Tax=Tissierella carlieri TaxID=689904 RepID=A0ABT1S578_9FIRM|nr:hypothetical protein [Tissierella carlieri]MCQ4921510.1 hypothetical protein [Tissierella carlieri]